MEKTKIWVVYENVCGLYSMYSVKRNVCFTTSEIEAEVIVQKHNCDANSFGYYHYEVLEANSEKSSKKDLLKVVNKKIEEVRASITSNIESKKKYEGEVEELLKKEADYIELKKSLEVCG